MSITKSICQRAPVTEPPDCGLLLIGHGSQRSDGPNAQLVAQADHLRKSKLFTRVEGAVLYGEPNVASALKALGDHPVHVVPMFMCDGLFTRKIIPACIEDARLEGQDITYGPPVGLSEGLSRLIATRITSGLSKNQLAGKDVAVVLVGHGSTASDASWQATERHAQRLRKAAEFKSVTTAYLDQNPKLADILTSLSGPVSVVGLFVADGLHAGDDIPALITATGKAEDICYLGAIGSDAGMVDLVVRQVSPGLAQ